jgi:hypothetical protein
METKEVVKETVLEETKEVAVETPVKEAKVGGAETKEVIANVKEMPELNNLEESKPEEIISLDDIETGNEQEKPLIGVSEPEEISIDTEPASVSFSNYDHVFDERQEPVGSFKYAPKDLEPGEIPRLVINEEQSTPLSLDSSVTALEAPGVDSDILADSILE